MGRHLQLNFTPLLVHGDAIRLQTLPFKDSQQLRDLRSQYRTQFAVTRRADQIVALSTWHVDWRDLRRQAATTLSRSCLAVSSWLSTILSRRPWTWRPFVSSRRGVSGRFTCAESGRCRPPPSPASIRIAPMDLGRSEEDAELDSTEVGCRKRIPLPESSVRSSRPGAS